MKIPVEGTHVNTVQTSGTANQSAGTQASDTPAGNAAEAGQGQPSQGNPAGAAPGSNIVRRTSHHPALDPSKYEFAFDQFGRATVKPKGAPTAEAPGDAEPLSEEGEVTGATPDLPAATAAGDGGQVAVLQGQVQQLTQTLNSLVQRLAQGGQPAQPAAPAEPDYSSLDLYDPATLSRFIGDTVKSAVQSSILPQTQQTDQVVAQMQYDNLVTTHGADAVRARGPILMELAKANPSATLPQLWAHADKLLAGLAPAQPATGKAPAAQPAARTITTEQAQQKAEQARRLPKSNSGVTGASGRTPPPAHVKGLGSIIAWNLQHNSGS